MTTSPSDPEPAASPAGVIRKHARGSKAALTAIDLANPGARVVTDRMRGTIDTLAIDLGELRFFLPRRPED